MRYTMRKLYLALFITLTIPAAAQDNGGLTDTEQAARTDSTDKSTPVEKSTEQTQPEIFVPSEAISEDLSVPFPVDI